jgi:hypothetical protein
MSPDGGSPAPIDRPVLNFLRDRLVTTGQVDTARVTEERGHLELLVTLSKDYYPEGTTAATLTVRWYTNGDFSVHYREERPGDGWECRWDRHPNPHNDREHFHPPPDARTPGEDESWPGDHREVLRLVLDAIEERVETLWGD